MDQSTTPVGVSSSVEQSATPVDGSRPRSNGSRDASPKSNGQRRPGKGNRWSGVADLRVELAQEAPQLARLGYPLAAHVIEVLRGGLTST